MAIPQYVDSYERATKFNDTMENLMFHAFTVLGDATKGDDGLVDKKKYEDVAIREKGVQQYGHLIRDFTKETLKSGLDESDPKEKMLLELAGSDFLGVRMDHIATYLEENGSKMSIGNYYDFIMRRTGYQAKQAGNKEAPKMWLGPEDGREVARLSGIESRIDPDLFKKVDDIASILSMHLEDPGIPDSALRGKHFFLDKKAPTGRIITN